MTLGDSLDSGEYLEGPNSRRRRDRSRYRDERRSWIRQRGHSPVGRLIAGVFIAAWGISLLLDNLGLGDMRQYIYRVWPAAFVIVGVTLLIHRDSKPDSYGFWGTVCMIVGTWLYLSQRDWIHLSFWSVIWPTLIVAFGVSFVYRGFRHSSNVP
jgi:hypothetical protein